MTAEDLLAWAGHQVTLADWEAMPEDKQIRLELVDGVLSIMPQPRVWHQRAATRLTTRLDEQLPRNIIALSEVEVMITEAPLTIRIPDVIVTHTEIYEGDPARLAAADVLLVVEILSDGTRKVDRILKFAEYAEAHVPQYWIIDLDAPPSLRAFTLVGDAYELSGEFTGAVTREVAGHAVTVDPGALVRR
jgi:Uma2 family endonuclease